MYGDGDDDPDGGVAASKHSHTYESGRARRCTCCCGCAARTELDCGRCCNCYMEMDRNCDITEVDSCGLYPDQHGGIPAAGLLPAKWPASGRGGMPVLE